jgi:hypothetical protein
MLPQSLLEAFMDRARPGWRERKERRKTLWHLPKLAVLFALIGCIGSAMFFGMWQVHVGLHPEHAGQLREFLPKGVAGRPLFASLLMSVPLFLPAVGIAIVLTNLVFWCIAPARRAFEREAIGDPAQGDEPEREMMFRVATRGSLRITAVYLLPIGIGLSLLGAWLLTSLR